MPTSLSIFTIPMFCAVFFGGAVGAILRFYLVALMPSLSISDYGYFSPSIMIVNILGSFLMGCALIFFNDIWTDTPHIKMFMIVGILGSFTTFSTFSFEAFSLFERGAHTHAVLYIGVSVLLSLGALVAGIKMTRFIVS